MIGDNGNGIAAELAEDGWVFAEFMLIETVLGAELTGFGFTGTDKKGFVAMGTGEGNALMGIGPSIAEVFFNPSGYGTAVKGEGFSNMGNGVSLFPEGGYLVDVAKILFRRFHSSVYGVLGGD